MIKRSFSFFIHEFLILRLETFSFSLIISFFKSSSFLIFSMNAINIFLPNVQYAIFFFTDFSRTNVIKFISILIKSILFFFYFHNWGVKQFHTGVILNCLLSSDLFFFCMTFAHFLPSTLKMRKWHFSAFFIEPHYIFTVLTSVSSDELSNIIYGLEKHLFLAIRLLSHQQSIIL
jgi:hypothetical protein